MDLCSMSIRRARHGQTGCDQFAALLAERAAQTFVVAEIQVALAVVAVRNHQLRQHRHRHDDASRHLHRHYRGYHRASLRHRRDFPAPRGHRGHRVGQFERQERALPRSVRSLIARSVRGQIAQRALRAERVPKPA